MVLAAVTGAIMLSASAALIGTALGEEGHLRMCPDDISFDLLSDLNVLPSTLTVRTQHDTVADMTADMS